MINRTEEEIQREFQENFNKLKAFYNNMPEGCSGVGGYTPGPCHSGLISMTCARLNKCVCHSNKLEEQNPIIDSKK